MIVLLIVLYFIIGLIVSIIGTYVDYRESWRTDIVDYIEHDFSVATIIIVLFFWPIILFWVFILYGCKNLYMATTILLDKLYKKRYKKRWMDLELYFLLLLLSCLGLVFILIGLGVKNTKNWIIAGLTYATG